MTTELHPQVPSPVPDGGGAACRAAAEGALPNAYSAQLFHPIRHLLLSPCRFLPLHRWFLSLALLDAILTALVLSRGGEELNSFARTIIETSGLTGMVLFKLAFVVLILLLIELIGRHREPAARAIALIAIAANTTAVTLGAIYLSLYAATASGMI